MEHVSILAAAAITAFFGMLSYTMRSRLDIIASELKLSRKELGTAVNELRDEIHRLALDNQRIGGQIDLENMRLEQRVSALYATKQELSDLEHRLTETFGN